jgi:hypothetical protein
MVTPSEVGTPTLTLTGDAATPSAGISGGIWVMTSFIVRSRGGNLAL